MSRFYDDAMHDSPLWGDESLQQRVGGATVIDATTLSDYLYNNPEKTGWNLLDDFFNIAPPFETFWVECRAPKQLTTPEGKKAWPSGLPTHWGTLFIAHELAQLKQEEKLKLPFDFSNLPQDCKWIVQAILFANFRRINVADSGRMIEPQFSWWFPVLSDGSQPRQPARSRMLRISYTQVPGEEVQFEADEHDPQRGIATFTHDQFNGSSLGGMDGGASFWNPSDTLPAIEGRQAEPTTEVWKERTSEGYFMVLSLARDITQMKLNWASFYTDTEEHFWLPLLQPCLMAVCFMHVKNVSMQRIVPPVKLQQHRTKSGKRPLCNYHVLEIQPFRKMLEGQGRAADLGVKKALHICRGHFHRYGMEWRGEMRGKLFGKYSGTFWVPAHLRGTVEVGLMDKMYRVDTKREVA